mgnify:CR=1 FL=1
MGSSLPPPVKELLPIFRARTGYCRAQLDVPARSVLARDPAELRVRRIGRRVVQVRMVREVEDLRPELERFRIHRHCDVLEQRDVPLILARAVDVVARSVADTCRPAGRANAVLSNQ